MVRLVLLFSFLFLSLAGGLAHAFPQDFEIQHTVYKDGRTIYVVTYQEAKIWQTRAFLVTPGQLQTVIFSSTFTNKRAAVAAHEKRLRAYGYVEPSEDDGMADLPVSEGEAVADVAVTGESIWPVTEKWSADWWAKYSDWIKRNLTPGFYVKYGLATDCADVVISSLWIFARIHGLPIANTLTGSHQMVGQMTMAPQWRRLPTADNWYEDQRFLAALNYVLDNTYTHSLSYDSYPVRITPETVVPGVFHLEFHEAGGGHAALVDSVRIANGRVRINTLNSTLPRTVRELFPREFVFGLQAVSGTGFMRSKWPILAKSGKWTFMPVENYPDYSDEQYQPEFMEGQGTFSDAVAARLTGNTKLGLTSWKNNLNVLKTLFVTRANVVHDGFSACQNESCAPGTKAWDEWSTPGRDGTLTNLIAGVKKTAELNADRPDIQQAWKSFLKAEFAIDQVGAGHWKITFEAAIDGFSRGKFDSDPRKSIDQRWGL